MKKMLCAALLSGVAYFACGPAEWEDGLLVGFGYLPLDGPCPEQAPEPVPPPVLDSLEVVLRTAEGKVHYSAKVNPRGGQARLSGIPPGEDLELEVTGWQGGAPAWKGAASQVAVREGKNCTASVFMTRVGEATCALRPLYSPRALLAAAPLADGRVLLIGGVERVEADGCGAGCPLWHASSRVDVFDPRQGMVYPLERMHSPRALASATVLADGTVLVVGGAAKLSPGQPNGIPFRVQTGDLVPSYEIYLPSRGVWLEKPLPEGMVYHSATLLRDGRVLLAGGGTGLSRTEASDRAYFFTPQKGSAGKLEQVPSRLASPRLGHVAVPTLNGHVIFLGGALVPTLGVVEEFNPEMSGGVFFARETSGHVFNAFFAAAAMIPLRPDEIFLAGGRGFDGSALLPPSAEQTRIVSHVTSGEVVFTLGMPMSAPRFLGGMVEVSGNRLLLAGGFKDSLLTAGDKIDLFDPRGEVHTGGSLSVARGGHALSALLGGRALLAGGQGPQGWLGSAEVFTPSAP